MTQPEDLIVGKSVEEIEAENSNRVNSSTAGEDRRDLQDTVLIPANNGPLGGQVGSGLAGLPGVFGTETRDQDGSEVNSRRDADRDSSEE